MDPVEEEILYQLKESNKLPPSESNDEDLSFGRMIAMNLKRLLPQQKAQAKIKIQQLLYDIEFSTPVTPPLPFRQHYQGLPYSDTFCRFADDEQTVNDDF